MVSLRETILCFAQACMREAHDCNPSGYHGPLCAAKLRILLAQPSGDDHALCACMISQRVAKIADFKSKQYAFKICDFSKQEIIAAHRKQSRAVKIEDFNSPCMLLFSNQIFAALWFECVKP